MINIHNSRRTYNIRCRWWKENVQTGHLQDLIHDKHQDGVFYAKEQQPKYQQENIDGGIVKIETETVTIETQDYVDSIKHDTLVEYLGYIWIVENVVSQTINKRSRYNIKPDKITWITLRKGTE